MARGALILAMAGAAMGFLLVKLGEVTGWEVPRAAHLYLFVPAAALGLVHWCARPSSARALPVVLCAAVVWLGLAYAGPTESRRGLLIALNISMVLPVAALAIEHRAWTTCANTYVFASAVVAVLTAWLEYQAQGTNFVKMLRYFGWLTSCDSHQGTANPNQVGACFALAAVLAFSLYLQRLRAAGATPRATGIRSGLYLVLASLLSLACLGTGSRGAACAWMAGMGILFWRATRTAAASRLRDVAALAGLVVFLALLASSMTEMTPWTKLVDRLAGSEATSIATAGSRLQIWHNALTTWVAEPSIAVVGTGTGMAEELIGAVDEGAMVDDYGNVRRNAHSAFVEWLVSFGLLGLVPGIWLVGWAWVQAQRLDRAQATVARQAFLITLLLLCVTGVVYRYPGWLAPAVISLCMLEPRLAALVAGKAWSPSSYVPSPGAVLLAPRTAAPEAIPAPHLHRPRYDRPHPKAWSANRSARD